MLKKQSNHWKSQRTVHICVCMDGCMHACMDGWMDGWMDECMDEWMYVCEQG